MISYDRFWQYIKKHNISQYSLVKKGISPSILSRLKKNQPVNIETIDRLCSIMDCQIEDLVEHIRDTEPSESR